MWLKRLFGRDAPADRTSMVAGSDGPTGTPASADDSFDGSHAELAAIDAELARARGGAAGPLIDSALQRAPQDPALLLRRGRLLRLRGEAHAALALLDALLLSDLDPDDIHVEIAECHLVTPDLLAALDSLETALAHAPDHGRALLRLGETLLRLDRYDEAAEPLRQSIAQLDGASLAQAHFFAGEAARLCKRFREAIQSYKTCVELDPRHVAGQIALGHIALLEEDEPLARSHYEEARRLSSNLPTSVALNLAIIQQNSGEFDGARQTLEQLLLQHPGNHQVRWYLAQADLLECRWQQGWENYGSRFGASASPYRPMPYRPWKGEDIRGETLLILADQGLGDEIMFASCFAEARRRCGHCIVECEPRLLPLFQRSMPDISFVATQRESSTRWLAGLPAPAWQITSGDLPALFRRQESNFEGKTPYLEADPARQAYWRERLRQISAGGPMVGISWRGGTAQTRTRARSLDIAQLAPILGVAGVRFVNLQYGDSRRDLEEFRALHGVEVLEFPEALADYDETAALVGALDLVVTVCTAIVHLAGAMGRPVWILCPLVPGWRYTAHRTVMPWYPSSRLFRQSVYGKWDATCQSLAAELRALTGNVTPSAR